MRPDLKIDIAGALLRVPLIPQDAPDHIPYQIAVLLLKEPEALFVALAQELDDEILH